MSIAQRGMSYVRGVLKRYGPSSLKERLWDKEFASTHWDFIDNTLGDKVYIHLAKYTPNGNVLDMGCGPGNTANEMAADSYKTYLGVDISKVALEKAAKRTAENGRTEKNTFQQADFISFTTNRKFEVVLFRESLYHVPPAQVKDMLDRYATFLTDGGLFIVRLYTTDMNGPQKKARPLEVLSIIEREFDVVEKAEYDEPGTTVVVVFKPRRRS